MQSLHSNFFNGTLSSFCLKLGKNISASLPFLYFLDDLQSTDYLFLIGICCFTTSTIFISFFKLLFIFLRSTGTNVIKIPGLMA